jgi:DNA-binding transcriptional regulator YdaS (Cro superfamily)
MKPIERAIKLAGGVSALATALDTTPQVIVNWRRRGVAADRCRDVEAVTAGAVTRHDLRPDIFGEKAEAA